ncbi:MAG: hypothetical protein HYR85_00165 [Planctomycetes bacterium]|nr:hypothetical protein [Planctomycetota bacterium]MBI3845001.1 hypothetical protein [Planctomycetota bacterium]
MIHGIATLAWLVVSQTGASQDPLAERIDARVSEISSKLQTDYESTLKMRPDRSQFANAFQIATAHYRVRCNDTYSVARTIADVLEKMRVQFQRLLDAQPSRSDLMNVFVFRTIEEYNQFGTTNGAQHSSNYGSFYSTQNAERPVATYVAPSSDSPDYTKILATHAAFHQYLAATSPTTLPAWLDEGLASYFEMYMRLDPWTAYVPSLGERWQKGLPVPLPKLMRDGVESYTENHYLEIGAFIYYLRHLRPDTSAVFDDFVRKVVRGDAVADSPVQKAVSGDLDATEKEFIAALRATKR